MGIINDTKDSVGPEVCVHDSNLLEYMAIEKPENPSETKVADSPARSSPRRCNQHHRYNPVRDYPANQHRRHGGVRRARRSENMSFLLGLAESEEGVENLADLVEPTVTAFSELFLEHEKMKIWNDFINRTEEDQEILLHASSQHNKEAKEDKDGAVVIDKPEAIGEGWEDLGDSRAMHPGYTAEECFKRMDSKLRTFLQRRQVPRGTLDFLESDVTAFFREWPSSVLVSKLNSSFERLLLHALCQYLDLTSHSFDGENGVRQTEVENKNHHFTPPAVSLTQFLEAQL